MNSVDLAGTLATDHARSKAEVRKAVEGLMVVILTAAGEGEEVSVAGFDTFKVEDRPVRDGRNPLTGKTRSRHRGNEFSCPSSRSRTH